MDLIVVVTDQEQAIHSDHHLHRTGLHCPEE